MLKYVIEISNLHKKLNVTKMRSVSYKTKTQHSAVIPYSYVKLICPTEDTVIINLKITVH